MVAHPPDMSTPNGRGRGYASLNKNLRPARGGGAPSMAAAAAAGPTGAPPTGRGPGSRSDADGSDCSARSFGDEPLIDENAQSVLYVEDKYVPLVDQLEVFQEKDDGIVTNQKIAHIETVLSKICVHPELLRGAMEALASATLLYASKCKKVAKLISLSRISIHQQRLHTAFVAALQDKIDGLEISLEGADQCFVNASTVLTDIYSESRSSSSEELTVLTHLIVQVSVGLLECNTALSLRTLNAQLMLYGKDMYKIAPEKFDAVSLSVRKLIIARQPPLPSSRIWLALLSDQCLYRFEPLPQYLQNFYARHLDDSNHDAEPRDSRFADDLPNRAENRLAKLPQTLREKRLSTKSDSSEGRSPNERRISQLSIHEPLKDDAFEGEAPSYEPNLPNDYYVNGQNQERKPRPILGAGSRLVQHRSETKNQDEIPAEIPKFCPNVPPPNFASANFANNDNSHKGAESKKIVSASQENGDFWNYPPPKLPPANLSRKSDGASKLSSRLDLNSWRQQGSKDPISEPPKLDAHSPYSACDNKFQYPDGSDGVQKNARNYAIDGQLNVQLNEDSLIEDSGKKKDDFYDSNVWERKKSDASNKEGEQNWRGGNPKPSSERKGGYDAPKRDSRTTKRAEEDKESNWKRRDSDEGKSDSGEKKMGGRREGRSRGAKKDTMEVSRKASYWTHDDRCDRDYDG